VGGCGAEPLPDGLFKPIGALATYAQPLADAPGKGDVAKPS
jgi:hypothetical protein